MVIISNVSYPTESTQAVAKRFIELPQVPDFMPRKGPYVSSSVAEGITIISLFELESSNLAAGLEFLGDYYANFFGIPGFKYEFKPFFHVAEALKMIGM